MNPFANSPLVTTLQAEERRLLEKLDKKAQSIQAQNPTLPYSVACGRALSAFPVTYRKYSETRAQLAQFGIRPQLPAGLAKG